MCNHEHFDPLDGLESPYLPDGDPPDLFTRRQLLKLLGGAVAATSVPSLLRLPSGRALAAASSSSGAQPVRVAMHVHSSFSELQGSMECQLSEAAANQVNVLYWTEHDWRMSATCYRTLVCFDSLTTESQFGARWLWKPSTSGSPTSVSGGIVSIPQSPADPSHRGALKVALKQSAARDAAYGYFADTDNRFNHHANINGLAVNVDIYPQTISGGGYLEVLMTLSQHLPRSGRPEGIYAISYRFGYLSPGQTRIGGHRPGTVVASGLLGIVTTAIPRNTYSTVTLQPQSVIPQLWPDIEPRDNAFFMLHLRAASAGAGVAEGYFDNMRLSYQSFLEAQATQSSLMREYAPSYPTVTQLAAQEVSFFSPHLNTYGASPPTNLYTGATFGSPAPPPSWFSHIADTVRQGGGLTSYNHVYGTSVSPVTLTPAQVAARQAATIKVLLGGGDCSADIFEAGYRQRGGMPLEAHLAAWDACSRNGLAMTGNGANDNHEGNAGQWRSQANRFTTGVWAASTAEADLLAALAAGRAFVSDISLPLTIDMALDDGTPMGGVTTRGTTRQRTLTVSATRLPAGSYFELIKGPVDYAGTANPTPGTSVVTTISSSAFAGGSVAVPLSVLTDSFYRLNLVDPSQPSNAQRIAFGNPIWIVNQPLKRVDPRRIHH